MKKSLLMLASLAIGTAAFAQDTTMPAPATPPATTTPAPDPAAAPATPAPDASAMPAAPAAAPAPAADPAPAAAPAAAAAPTDDSSLPYCSRSVTDKCKQHEGGAKKAWHKKK